MTTAPPEPASKFGIFKVFIELPLALLKANPKQANRRAI